MNKFRKIILMFSIFGLTACTQQVSTSPNRSAVKQAADSSQQNSINQNIPTQLVAPISNAASRTTKKTFGLKVSPSNSPVSPEKFSGYHTGTDFETTPAEQNSDVQITAVCDGKLLLKKYATGYGGVAVQSCTYNNQPITIIYGHLRFSSIAPNIGSELKQGDFIALLGTGYSTETDGERKHLHLGIHKGASINILGYVQKQSDLKNWYDPQAIIPGLK